MDKENGETSESGTGSSKVSNQAAAAAAAAAEQASLLDAANLFGAYWQRDMGGGGGSGGGSAAAGLFAAASGSFPSPMQHHGMPFGLLPPGAGGRGAVPSFPPVSSAAAYTNTLSVAASQAASLGINPAASAAWWSMASQLAAQDYLARLQASGLNFPSLSNPGDLQYASLGLPPLSSHHKSSSKNSKSSSLSKNSSGSKSKTSATALSLQAGAKLDGRLDPLGAGNKSASGNSGSLYNKSSKVASKNSNLQLQSSGKLHVKKPPSLPSPKPSSIPSDKVDYSKQQLPKSSTPKSSHASTSASSIFTSPLSLVSNSTEKASCTSLASCSGVNTFTTQSLVNSSISSGIPPNILSAALEGSDPSSILGGVRLPPDTEIIKYTSSIVGPKIPGTTNRGRKKTISLDPPSVSVMPTHSSTGMLIERGSKWAKLNQEPHDLSGSNDRVEVIKLPATNGSPSGINIPSFSGNAEPSNDAPLNLSLKPASSSSSTNCQSNSLNSLSTLSANIGNDRISRRKPGPKPRRVIQSPSPLSATSSVPGAPSASLAQLFAAADSPRPPSRSDDSASESATPSSATGTTNSMSQNHKDGRPRNLGRGVSKPKKNTVASLLAQSRALGIKPMQIDPNTPMNQQISLLKSNMLAAQYLAGGDSFDERHLEKFRGALSDSSNMEVSTDSDNLTDSNQTDSEAETDANGVSNPKKRRMFNERELRLPLEQGWKRETIIRGLAKNGGIRGDVCYTPPDTNNKLKQMSDIGLYLEQVGNQELTRDHFTFSCKIILGDYLQKPPPGTTAEGEYLRMTEEDVTKRLDDLRALTRSNLAVEQRIEVARRQQAARTAARLDREHARIQRDIERSEKQEAAKRDREVRSQQLLEGRKRLAFTLEQKIQIISEIEGGKTKSDVSRELGLASSTVATIWKNRDNILNAYGTDVVACNDADGILSKTKNDSTLSESALTCSDSLPARRKRHEELGRQRMEEQQRKIQEREMKKQQAALLKEQMYIQEINKQREMLYTVELERERRRQHMSLVKALEGRRRLEERERKKQQAILEKQASKERRLEQRRIDMEILTELRKPCEDLELSQKPLPEYPRIPGLRVSGQAFADILMVFEFLHNFGETLGFDMESLPCLDSLQQALLNESLDAEEEILSVMTHLLVCAIEDPGIPNPARHTTILGQSLRQADITHSNLSEILRIYLYANATGEVKALTGVHFERDRERRVADHYQSNSEMQHTQGGKNAMYYEHLHENITWQMSDSLKDKPFLALSPTDKAAMLAFICNELLQNKAVIRQIEGSLDTVAQLRKERWLLDTKIRKYRMMTNRKLRTEAAEKMQAQLKDGLDSAAATGGGGDVTLRGVDSPAPTPTPHKDDLLGEDDEEISENESEGTQPEEEEDKKLSGEELSKKLDKLVKSSEAQLESLNKSAHQLRATCFGQDRFWRRYWQLPTAGSMFIEAMESAQPEVLAEQINEQERKGDITSIEDIKKIVPDVESLLDPSADKEVSQIVGGINNEIDNNEHRKTPNRVEASLEESQTHEGKEIKMEVDSDLTNKIKTESDDIEEQIPSKLVEKPVQKKFNLFEKLGECMEKENKVDLMEDEKKPTPPIDVKQEVKAETVEAKTEVKMEVEEEKPTPDLESRWFSILIRDSHSCDGVSMSSGNRWDTNTVGVCTRESFATELKIPVFPPPNCQNSFLSCNSCDSPGPLQMSAEESSQLEYIKQHGPPPRLERVPVPTEMRTGWWRTDQVVMQEAMENMHPRGVRERELKRTVQTHMQQMYECAGTVHIEEGNKIASEMHDCPESNRIVITEAEISMADKPGAWNPAVATRVDFSVLEQVEALEDKVANASMQVKGWKVPNRDAEEVSPGQAVSLAKERLASLEAAIERRYLKPPLGVSTGDANLAAMAQEAHNMNSNNSSSSAQQQREQREQREQQSTPPTVLEEIPKGLTTWRDAVQRCKTSAQLAMCLYMLEASIAWDKSIMKANCQFCHSGDNEDKLLLCDSCDKGYHTYCFRPKMETIPDGNWYCHECINKVTGERNCIVCGKKQSNCRLLLCDLCPRAYHQDCLTPPLQKVPRGKWYCPNCHSKQPKKRNSRRSNNKATRDSESSDHPPTSPAPSHSSVTTNEELTSALTISLTPKEQQTPTAPPPQTASPSTSVQRKERVSKKLQKELAPCKTLLEDLECHDDAWPFLLPVNTKQFPTYKKIITSPMDLSTIKKRLQDLHYKSREEFCMDVRQIFDNCETFNEDDSPVGKAGHCMRQFFEARWNELCPPHPGKS